MGKRETKDKLLNPTVKAIMVIVVAGLILGVLVWIAKETWENGKLLAKHDIRIDTHDKQLKDYDNKLTDTNNKLTDTNNKLADIYKLLINDRLKQAAANPRSKINIEQTKEILLAAKKASVRIDPDTIKDAGAKFSAVAMTQPDAWATVREVLDYRSFLNTTLAPSPPPQDLTPAPAEIMTGIKIKKLSPNGSWKLLIKSGAVSLENSARLEQLDKQNPISKGVELIMLEGKDAAILLDGQYMKNVIVRNMNVVYKGGPVILDHVYFVNCTFDFQPGPKSHELSKAILANTATSFLSIP